MFRVRYPDGTTIQYNTAHFLSYKTQAWELYEKKDGPWVASIQLSAGVIVEAIPACRVYNASEANEYNQMAAIKQDIAAIRRKIAKLSNSERK